MSVIIWEVFIKLCNSSIVLRKGQISFSGDVGEGVEHYISIKKGKSFYDFSSFSERYGNGLIKIMDLSFWRKEIQTCNFLCGDDFTAIINYEMASYLINAKIEFRIVISDSNGNPIALLSDRINSNGITYNGCIKCCIPKLPLLYGNYIVTLSVHVDGDLSDWIREAAGFRVDEGNYYNGSLLPTKDYGPYLFDYIWKNE